MAGPTVDIITKHQIDKSREDTIRAFIKIYAGNLEGTDFDINNHPFSYEIGDEYEGELEELHILEKFLGWIPRDILGLIAYCNSNEDHEHLGKICYGLLDVLDGVVDFGGPLGDETNDQVILKNPGVYTYHLEEVSCPLTVMTPEAFQLWLHHKDFKMCK
ncbi:MAG: hypothetical protein JW860_10100 [Sedimentisphaerales bacterium]|nr:hypothetical protein [Sedimentisphaerales bacterium]